jgi:hypothetical protein
MATDSEMHEEIPRRNRQHLATGGSGDTGAFGGDSPIEGDGTVHVPSWYYERRAQEQRELGGGTDQPAEESRPAPSPELQRIQRELDAIRDAQARDREVFGRRAESSKPED